MVVAKMLSPARVVRRVSPRWAAGVLAVALSGLFLGASLDRGWVPHDTGQLGHSAERVLRGELPHRDFDEPYTGGLSDLHALAFRLLGVRAEAMRWTLAAYFLLYVAAVYVMAIRVASPWTAGAVAFLCASLSVPIYSAGVPSWYNLFFAVFGSLALLQHIDTGRRRWLFWAGCCGGCSLMMKITGVYFVAAGLIYIAHREQGAGGADESRSRSFSVLMSVCWLAVGGAGLLLARGERPLASALHFGAPLAVLAAYGLWSEWRAGRGGFRSRLGALSAMAIPFLAGVVCPLLPLAIHYQMAGALPDLTRGLFVLPAARLDHAALALPEAKWMLLSLPAAALLLSGSLAVTARLDLRRWTPVLIACLLVLLAISGTALGYFVLFQALRNLIPPALTASAAALVLAKLQGAAADKRRQALLMLVAVTALTSLVQFPYGYGTYFFYVAPLLFVTMLYTVSIQRWAPLPMHAAVLALALVLAVFRFPQSDPRLMNGFYEPDFPVARLGLPRCDLTVYGEDARAYRELISLVQSLTPAGGCVYAAPDCPEVYFLSGRENPTRGFYDCLSPTCPPPAPRLLQMLDRRGVRVVVINHRPAFSDAMDPRLVRRIEDRFPHRRSIFVKAWRKPGRVEKFTVLWRDGPSRAATGGRHLARCDDRGRVEHPAGLASR